MAKSNDFYRVWAFIRHFFTSWNTTGEGIHSPYLFELVRFVLRDRNTYYCFADIERRREVLLASEETIDVIDYGSAGSPEGKPITRSVSQIAKTHLERAQVGRVLFRLVNWLGEKEKRPLEILELGTSLGVTTAYLAAADSRNKVTTLEGSTAVLRIAQDVWKTLKMENITWKAGNIDDTLYEYTRALDVAYVDANHTYEATMRYVNYLLPLLPVKGIIVLDDIHYSEQMERAWNELKADPRVTTSMDLYHVGILFVDPHYLKRHYTIRI